MAPSPVESSDMVDNGSPKLTIMNKYALIFGICLVYFLFIFTWNYSQGEVNWSQENMIQLGRIREVRTLYHFDFQKSSEANTTTYDCLCQPSAFNMLNVFPFPL